MCVVYDIIKVNIVLGLNDASGPFRPSPEVVSCKKIRFKTIKFSRKMWAKQVFFHAQWRAFQNAACNGLQTYVIAVEKCDLVVFVPSKSKDMKLVYIAHI